MVAFQRLLGVVVEERQRFLRPVVELLLHREGNRHIPALIQPVVADEAVHLGPQNECLADGGADDVEKGVLVLRPSLVQLLEIGIYRAKIDIHRDVRLVVRPVGHDRRCNPVHGRNILQPDSVPAVAPFLLFHSKSPCFFRDDPIIADMVGNCNLAFFDLPLYNEFISRKGRDLHGTAGQ